MEKKLIIFLITIVSVAGIAYAAPATVPRTGQVTSYGTGTIDDGALQRGVAWPNPRFTVTYCDATGPCSNQSTDCDSNAITDVVTDNLTGLMWARTPDYPLGKGWQEALNYASSQTLCGFHDWRLPNINELESLVNVEQANQTTWLNAQGFNIVTGDSIYWSSSALAASSTLKLTIITNTGAESTFPEISGQYAWPVRSGL